MIVLEKGKLLEEIKKDKKIGLNEELENIIKKREGKWFVSGIVSSRPDDMQDMYNIILNKLSNGYIANQMSKKEAIDYELLSLGGTGIIIAYFNDANGNEYGITFTDREDLTGVTNGKLYTLDEIFNIIESNISIMSPVNNEVDLFDLEIFGGSANKEKSSQFPLENPSLLILSGDLIITAMTILLIKKRVAKIKS